MAILNIVALWVSGFVIGITVMNLLKIKDEVDNKSFWIMTLALRQEKDISHMLARRVAEDDITIKKQRWLLEGGIDGNQDLEDISQAEDGGDQYLEARAQAYVETCRSLSLLNSSDGLQRGLESVGRV